MLISQAATYEGLALLKADQFQLYLHRIVFEAIGDLARSGEVVDCVTVRDVLRARRRLRAIGGGQAVDNLLGYATSITPIRYYANAIRQMD